MSDTKNGTSCAIGVWALAAGAGFLTFVLLLALGGYKVFAALFLAAVVFILLGLLLMWLCCAPLPKLGEAPKPGSDAADETRAAPEKAPKIATGAGPAAAAATSAPVASSAEPAPAATPAPAPAPAPAKAEAAVKPSKALDGEADLDARKGDWKYEGDGAAKTAAAPAAAPTAKASTPDYDGDGAAEGENEGTRPEALDGPRGGKADNLKEIKGIGPKLEKLCNQLGFYHFDQIANWSADEVAWVNANLEGFKGRVTRDEWVAQAKILAEGGETEFSKRVEGGDVY
ncbi:endonuclease [Pseudaestuariivita sp.]|uniref:endonuclease n=1 Tax=Pseudaestuariivita sp. TaxID=2211669 RepID=UPI004059E6BA